ncbi:hypothetical protein ABE67_17230 [Cytobacillus firmus]|nr:hypothetical protein [Cytobacillus firmus]
MSPNPGQLRTQKRENTHVESEPGSTLDSEKGNRPLRVRTQVNFGHKKGKTHTLSPNPGQLRTQKRENTHVESEPGATSDTEKGKHALRVRTRVNFGHKKGKRATQSPNPGQLRTQKRNTPS